VDDKEMTWGDTSEGEPGPDDTNASITLGATMLNTPKSSPPAPKMIAVVPSTLGHVERSEVGPGCIGGAAGDIGGWSGSVRDIASTSPRLYRTTTRRFDGPIRA